MEEGARMAAESSSRGRPTKKAGSHDRSISSSTIGRTAADASPLREIRSSSKPPDCIQGIKEGEITSETGLSTDTWTEPTPLKIGVQKELIRLLSLGASPAAACESLSISFQDALLTFETDNRFRARLEQIHHSLTENIRAALYREGMKGNVTAQTYWLKEDATHRKNEEDRVRKPPGELLADLERVVEVLKASGLEEAGR
jgi:hypothetical protein